MSIRKRKPTILGIDPSINGTGLVVLGQRGEVIYSEKLLYRSRKIPVYEVIKKNGAFDKADEIEICHNDLKGFIASERIGKIIDHFKVTVVVMENYAFGTQAGRVFNIGEFVGALKVSMIRGGIDFTLIPPNSMKLYITGIGNAKKEVILANLIKKYNINFDDEDLNDAYALARMALELGPRLVDFCDKKGMLDLKAKLKSS